MRFSNMKGATHRTSAGWSSLPNTQSTEQQRPSVWGSFPF
ncbi:rCG52210, isoform CRA_a [Rattus norvegicus]|uniref:RCG52210, isoform CRA_a n=1 Tax=Rattus norvegicus TaxID=10116 RepID=A6K6Q5_RAT|nr:rCG52210, isoform CRA_a [Rattus norvegicus]